MEFFDWPGLASFTGALTMVAAVTQMTKNWGVLQKIPTQLWSYIIALVVLYPAYYFSDRLTLASGLLIPFNAVIVTLSANGSFDAVKRILSGTSKK